MFGEDPACFISTGNEIDENLIKEILGSKDIREAQLLKFAEEIQLNAEIIVLSFYSHTKKQNSNGNAKRKKSD